MKILLLAAAAALAIPESALAQTPSNDNCPGLPVFGTPGNVNFRVNSENATNSTITDSMVCSARPTNIKDVFFDVEFSTAGYYRIYTDSHTTTGYDTVMTAYEGLDCDGGNCIAYGDDISPTNYGSEIFIGPMEIGDAITVQVGAWDDTVVPVSTNNLRFQLVDPPGDVCSEAIPIATGETKEFDTGLYTDGFDNGSFCGGDLKDIYYEWTVPEDGAYTFRLDATFNASFALDTDCTDLDTGGCLWTSSLSTCGGTQELRLIGMTAGTTWFIKVGGLDTLLPSGEGIFEIWPTECDPCENDDGWEGADDCSVGFTLAPGYVTGLFVATGDEDYYRLCIPAGGDVDVSLNFTHADGDIDLELYEASDPFCGDGTPLVGSYSTADTESLVWTNTSGQDVEYIVRVFLCCGDGCNTYDMNTSDSDRCLGAPDQNFCSPTANSTGNPAFLSATISPPNLDLHLDVFDGPPNQFGYFLVGTAISEPGITVSQGQLCLAPQDGNLIGRFNVAGTPANSIGQFNSLGNFENLVGTSSYPFDLGFDVPNTLPLPGSPTIQAGATWHFQVWYRDTLAGAGASNFSNGVSVTF